MGNGWMKSLPEGLTISFLRCLFYHTGREQIFFGILRNMPFFVSVF